MFVGINLASIRPLSFTFHANGCSRPLKCLSSAQRLQIASYQGRSTGLGGPGGLGGGGNGTSGVRDRPEDGFLPESPPTPGTARVGNCTMAGIR